MQRTPTNDLKTAEILYGISALPAGRRRSALAAAATAMFAEDFAGRILPFEARAAARYPDIVLARRQAGNPIEKFDALIAATLPWEDGEEYRSLLEAFVAEHKPKGPTEEHLVEELAGVI